MDPESDLTLKQQLEALRQNTINCFLGAVKSLKDRKHFPNPEINQLMENFLSAAVERELISIAVTNSVSSCGFARMPDGQYERAAILIPWDFITHLPEGRFEMLGAVVYTTSLAVASLNGIGEEEELQRRALIMEAKFLRTEREICPDFQPNEYQQTLLDCLADLERTPSPDSIEFPLGLSFTGRTVDGPVISG